MGFEQKQSKATKFGSTKSTEIQMVVFEFIALDEVRIGLGQKQSKATKFGSSLGRPLQPSRDCWAFGGWAEIFWEDARGVT
jgi:hypothetical protein